MTAEALLDRLDKVRGVGASRWMACCPAHADKSPSLSIRETEDGRVLVHCFGGCGVDDIVAAAGLELHDLFPPRDPGHKPAMRRPWSAAELLHLIDRESLIVLVCVADAVAGKRIEQIHVDRLMQARRRIAAVVRELPT